MIQVTGERGCLISTEQIILSTRLCKFSPFGEHSHGTQIPSSFHPFRKIDLHTSSPGFLVTNFPIMFLLSLWPSNKPIGHSPWISTKLHIWPFLPQSTVNNQEHCSKFCPLGGFSYSTVLQECSRKWLECCSCTCSGAACISHRTMCKLSLSFLFVCQLIMGEGGWWTTYPTP